MFKIKDTNGNEINVNEIYEDGFNVTMDMVNAKRIFDAKPDILGEYLTKSMKKFKENNAGEVIPTGITSLDEVLGGGLKNGLYVIGANPGMGKTSLMLHILINLAINKKSSLFFSLDMSDIQTTIRLVANTSYRFPELDNKTINDLSNSKVLFDGGDVEKSIKKIYDTFHSIASYINVLSIHEDVLGKVDRNITYVESVETAIKNAKKYMNIIPVVVIDFLQMLQNKPISNYRDENDGDIIMKSYDRRIEVDKIIVQLKEFSSTYKVPIIVITSTNRSSYTKNNSYENSDYDIGFSKESGNIEYMADVLIRLTSGDGITNFGGPDQQRVNLNIVKSRFGRAQITVPLNFLPEYAFFSEVTND